MRKLERKRWKWVKQAVEQAALEGRTLSENEKHDISNKAKMEYISRHVKEFEGHPTAANMSALKELMQ